MAEHDCISEEKISKAQRRYKVGYVRVRHEDRNTGIAKYYSQHPGIHLKGDWLKDAGFETGAHLTVKISDGCIVLILDNDEVDELKHDQEALRQQLRDSKQANRDMKSAAKAALRGMRV